MLGRPENPASSGEDFASRIGNCALSTRIASGAGVCAAAGALVAILFGVVDRWFDSETFALSLIPCLVILVYSIGAAMRSRLDMKAAMDDEERFLLERKGALAASAFEDDGRSSLSTRKFSAYINHAPRIVSAVAFLVLLGGLYLLWNNWGMTEAGVESGGDRSAFVAAAMALLFFFFGVFCVGQSRSRTFRWLRPVGVWMVLAAVVMLAGTAAILLADAGYPKWDATFFKTFAVILVILNGELAANFVMEFYRPRTVLEERPVFESRLLALVTEPGGLLRNIADTLDYQFGYQVSATWVYRFAERSFSPLLLCWLALFWLATAFDEVPSNSIGVREVFGARAETLLGPGFHVKWPWPIEKIRKFPVAEVREIAVGAELKKEGGKETTPSVVLWTQPHYAKQYKFLVANKATAREKNKGGTDSTPPVSFISTYVPIQFKIRPDKLIEYAYENANPDETLRFLAEKEVSSYFASADMLNVMSSGRGEARRAIKKRIQAAADANGLGVEIVEVALLDAHPPTEEQLPESFQAVVGAEERKETMIWEAKRDEAKTIPAAEAESARLTAEAKAIRTEKIELAKAEKIRFEKRLVGYRAMPEMYLLNLRLDFLERSCANIRKYVIANAAQRDVFVINLEEKRRLDLLDVGDFKETPANQGTSSGSK